MGMLTINQGSAREAEPLDILIYIKRFNKEQLMWLWTWLGKSEVHSQVIRKGKLEIFQAEAAIHRWHFFFFRKAPILFLRLFNRLNQVHPDYLE